MSPLSEDTLSKFLLSAADTAETKRALAWAERELGVTADGRNVRAVRAIAAVKAGATPEAVARVLDWKEFEGFCASLLRAKGLTVEENITMTKPRVQVDLLARSVSVALVIDCKHWGRTVGASSLSRVAAAQALRADRLRGRLDQIEPMVVVILVLSNEATRYVNGAAVVPVQALGNFIDDLDRYTDGLPRH
jgi:hypothetical protein